MCARAIPQVIWLIQLASQLLYLQDQQISTGSATCVSEPGPSPLSMLSTNIHEHCIISRFDVGFLDYHICDIVQTPVNWVDLCLCKLSECAVAISRCSWVWIGTVSFIVRQRSSGVILPRRDSTERGTYTIPYIWCQIPLNWIIVCHIVQTTVNQMDLCECAVAIPRRRWVWAGSVSSLSALFLDPPMINV